MMPCGGLAKAGSTRKPNKSITPWALSVSKSLFSPLSPQRKIFAVGPRLWAFIYPIRRVARNIRVEIGRGILRNTVLPDLEMKVRTGGPSCAAHSGDWRPRLYRIALVHIHLAARGVQCGESIAVVDHQVIPAFRVKAGLRHGAVRSRQHRGSPFGRNVDPIVDGFPLSAGIPSGSEGVAEADGIVALHRPLKPAALLFADGINAVNVRLLVPGQLGQDRPCPVFISIQPQTAGGEGCRSGFLFLPSRKVASTVRCAPLKVSMLSHVSCFMSSLAVGSSSGGTQKP